MAQPLPQSAMGHTTGWSGCSPSVPCATGAPHHATCQGIGHSVWANVLGQRAGPTCWATSSNLPKDIEIGPTFYAGCSGRHLDFQEICICRGSADLCTWDANDLALRHIWRGSECQNIFWHHWVQFLQDLVLFMPFRESQHFPFYLWDLLASISTLPASISLAPGYPHLIASACWSLVACAVRTRGDFRCPPVQTSGRSFTRCVQIAKVPKDPSIIGWIIGQISVGPQVTVKVLELFPKLPVNADPNYIGIVLQWLYKAGGPFQVAFWQTHIQCHCLLHSLWKRYFIRRFLLCWKNWREHWWCISFSCDFKWNYSNKIDSNIPTKVEALQISSIQKVTGTLEPRPMAAPQYPKSHRKSAPPGLLSGQGNECLHPHESCSTDLTWLNGAGDPGNQDFKNRRVQSIPQQLSHVWQCMEAKLRNMRPTPVSSTDCQFTSRPRRLRQEW